MKRLVKKLVLALFKGRYAPQSFSKWLVLLFDCFLFFISFWIYVLIKYIYNIEYLNFQYELIHMLPLFVAFLINSFIFGSYQGLVRYSGFGDVKKIGFVCLGTFILAFMTKTIVVRFIDPSNMFIVQKWFLSHTEVCFVSMLVFIFMTISRLIIRRIYNENISHKQDPIKTIIYGAGDAGIITKKALKQDTSCYYDIVAFADDSSSKVGKTINGVPVYKPSKILNQDYISKNNIQTIILALPSVSKEQRTKIINEIINLGLVIKSVPHLNNWIDNDLTANQIEDIKIEDLLGREPIVLGKENVTEGLKGKVVMVTGAAGSIGSEICRQVLHYKPKKLILLDQAESPLYDIQFELRNNEPYRSFNVPMEFVIGNVKDNVKMREVFSKHQPQIVYHAAAYKHVPLMEEFPYEAVFVNVLGTKNVADLAIEFEVEKFVMVSTDKAVNPTNVMGATKRIAEIYTQSRKAEKTSFVTTRFGNVLGSNGSVIPLFKKQLAYGGPLTVTDRNIIRYFMTIPEACSLVLEAGVMGEKEDIFVFDMGEPVKIYDLAKKMIKLSHKQNIEIEITGLRPGEKLYEELLSTKENTIPTEHAKIMRAKVRRYTEEEVNEKIDTLINLIPTCDDFKIVAQMKNIVPEFISNNSIYSCLDKKEN
ncbi:MAG: polysaccharide biosynthesis protein [Lentimicrobiaceae bacterium]|nr:polysaccharide biosynthesis protein [Lentimicrobiaceae bacterium]